jgi:hypothetical protein
MSIPFAWLFRMRGARAAFFVAAVYVGIYAGLTLCGQYQGNVSSLERLGIITRGVSDVWEWQPAGVIVTHFSAAPGQPRFRKASFLGYCFRPLVMIDQQYCHATKPIGFAL